MEDVTGGAEDERQWVSLDEAVSMLGLTRRYVLRTTKERGYTRRQAHCRASPFFLRREIASWADFRQLRREWVAKYQRSGRGKRWTEKIDEALARRLFITTKEAALLLGVARSTVSGLVGSGRLPCYQSVPGHRGAQAWFSRRAVLQLAEDADYLERRKRSVKKSREDAGNGAAALLWRE